MKNVLIVDDDESVRFAVQVTLGDANYSVETASNGQECIGHLKNGFSGIVLLDVMMPDMDGWQTIHEIVRQELDSKIIIIMLTAKYEAGSETLGLQEHVFNYITKPYQPDDLIQKVRDAEGYLP